MDALAHRAGPRVSRRTFIALTVILGFVIGAVSAAVTSQLLTNRLQSKLAKLEQTADAATKRLAQIDVFTKAEYDLMVASRSTLTAGVAMARIFNSSPLAAIGRSGSDVVLILPKGQVSLEPADGQNERLVIRKDIIGNGIEQNFFELQVQKASEKESAPPANP